MTSQLLPLLSINRLRNLSCLNKICRSLLTLVFLSTHSSHDKVGLLRFCFFLRGSAVEPCSFLVGAGEAWKVDSVAVGETDGYEAGDVWAIWSMLLSDGDTEIGCWK